MKPLLVSLTACLAFLNGSYCQTLCSVCETLKNNVVQITATFADEREENGFGTVIGEKNNKLYIVTAKHVIYSLDNGGLISSENKTKAVAIKFYSEQGKDYPATLLQLPNTNLDISLLEVEKPKNYNWTKDFYSKALSKGTRVWFIGRSGKWYVPTGSFVGSVNDVSAEDEISIDINSIQPGTSGAPLISPDGMVGLIFEDAAGGAKAYPIDKVVRLITKTWNYEWQMNLNSNTTQPDVSEEEDKAWMAIIKEKKEANQIQKLEDYVSKGQGSHVDAAKKMFEGLLWANINKEKYMAKYVQHFPEGQYIRQVEDKVYRSSDFTDLYVRLFPNGRYINQAKNSDEDKIWSSIRDGFDLSIDEYFKKYPQGKYIGQLDELLWQRAVEKEGETTSFKADAFKDYLKYFPSGKHAAAAEEKAKKYQ